MKRSLHRLVIAVCALGLFLALGVPAHAAISFVAETHFYNGGAATSNTLSLSGSLADGELVIFNASNASGATFTTTPTGYTCPKNDHGILHCWHVWHTGDAISITVGTVSGTQVAGNAPIYSGEDQTNPIDIGVNGTTDSQSFTGGSFGNAIIPGVSPNYQNEVWVAFIDNVCNCSALPGSPPTGFTSRSASNMAGTYDQALGANTNPVGSVITGVNLGNGTYRSIGSLTIRPASAISGTQHPLPFLACLLQVGGNGGTVDLTKCNIQNNDLVLLRGSAFVNGGELQLTPPVNYTVVGNAFYQAGTVPSGESMLVQHTWKTNDQTSVAFNYINSGPVTSNTYAFVYRLPTGAAPIISQATMTPGPVISSAGTVSSISGTALTTTETGALYISVFTGGWINANTSSYAATNLVSYYLNNGNGDIQGTSEQDLVAPGTALVPVYSTFSPAVYAGVLSFFISANPPNLPTITSSSACQQSSGTTIPCAIPSGSTGDLLVAPVVELANPGASALTLTGWTLLKYQADDDMGLPGVTLPDKSIVGLGPWQALIATGSTISPSGTALYSLHWCFQTPRGWGSGGGGIAVDANQNGTGDNLDRGLRLNPSGQVQFLHGSTGSIFSGATAITSTRSYADGQPHCATGVWDGTDINLYVDGASAATPVAPTTTSVTLPSPNGYWVMGCVKQNSAYYCGPFRQGQFAEWDGTALNSTQVASIDTHMRDGTFDTAMAALSPTHWWKANEVGSTLGVAADSGSSSDPGVYIALRGRLNQLAMGGMGDKSPWFDGGVIGGGSAAINGASVVENVSDTAPTSAFSVTAFIKVPTTYKGGGVIAEYSSNNSASNAWYNQNAMLYLGSDSKLNLGMSCANAAQNATSSTATLNDGTLHFVAGTWDGTTLKVYIDGTQSGSGTSCTSPSNNQIPATMPYIIGAGGFTGNGGNWPDDPSLPNGGGGGPNSGGLAAYIGRVATWNSALSSGNISTLESHVNDGMFDSTLLGLSPIHYYKLNETGGNTAIDYGSAAHNATYTGFINQAVALWEKTRGASEASPVSFPLGSSTSAMGAVFDVPNLLNQVDATDWNVNSGLDTKTYGVPIYSSDTNAMQIDITETPLAAGAASLFYPGWPQVITGGNVNIFGATGPTTPDTGATFDGATNYIKTPYNPGGPSQFTQCFGFKVANGYSAGGIFISDQQSLTSTNANYTAYMDTSGHTNCSYYEGASVLVTSPSTYNDGNFHLMACVADNVHLTLYMDGSSVAQASASGSYNPGGTWWIGAGNNNGIPSVSKFLAGTMGEVAVWVGSYLTGAQVASLTTHQNDGTFDATMAALAPTAWWKLADPGPIYAQDAESLSGNGYGNTGVSMPLGPLAAIMMRPYTSSPSLAPIMNTSYAGSRENFSLSLVMPEGVPPPPSSGGWLYPREED